jgi:malonate decarboxylase alpha subunit
LLANSNRMATNRGDRPARAAAVCDAGTKICPPDRATKLLEAIIKPGDRVTIEGDNQKQADLLAAALAKVDPARAHGLHMVQPVLALPDHLAVFERGIANRLDFAFAGPQSRKLAELVEAGRLKIGAIHTYLELYARMMVDLTPHVALVVADKADGQGNLYTGPNTEDTPTLVEATAFRGGIVVAQVNEIVEHLPRVDIPGDWVDVVVPTARPYAIEPLFTRDPAKIREDKILMAMMAIAAVYEPYEIRRLNHGIGYATAAIELILPTFGAARGLEGKVATHFVLNPHPTLIPAIEAGSVERIYCFGSELGMERYMAAHPDVFPVGRDGSLRSNRALAQVAGHYACDLFIGGTLQIDARGNSSTATRGRIAGFGGAPNMGADARGRRHPSPAWLRAGREAGEALRGRKLVVQMVETCQPDGTPSFVERLDAFDLATTAGFELPPVMIHGDDVTHVITEEGVANLLLCRLAAERTAALRAIAGDTEFGRARSAAVTADLRKRGIVMRPTDLCIAPQSATRDLLAAQTIDDLVRCSGGLYEPPARFRQGSPKTMPAAGREQPSRPALRIIPRGPDMAPSTRETSSLKSPDPCSWLERLWASLAMRGSADVGRPGDVVPPLARAKRLAEALLSERGEASGAVVARELHDCLRALGAEDRLAFHCFLATGFQPDAKRLRAAAEAYLAESTAEGAARLAEAAEPARQELLRRMNMSPCGTAALVAMRKELSSRLRDEPELKVLDADLKHLFASWFNRGFLELRRIDWQSPAAVLDKLIAYEAVHEIQGWEDLRRRLAPDRRCFGFFHPALPGEPLIFVWVALVEGLAAAVQPLLARDSEEGAARRQAERADTAIFYSISNCQDGLRGVSFGNFLIKQVVEELKAELPHLSRFSTLSPVPGFRRWLEKRLAAAEEADAALLAPLKTDGWWQDAAQSEALRRPMMRLCGTYLTGPSGPKGPADPVARFHLGNGARLERVNWLGNVAPRGIEESYGIMVNYLYDPETIEANHEAFAHDGTVARSPEVDALMALEATPSDRARTVRFRAGRLRRA